MTEADDSTEQSSSEVAPVDPSDITLNRLLSGAINKTANSDSDNLIPSITLSERYSGPFAHPDLLGKLDKVIENGAERAFSLTEKEQQHRHSIEDQMLSSEIKHRDKESVDRRLVILLVFSLLLLSLIGTFIAIMLGHPIGGGLVGGFGAIISAATLFVTRSRSKDQS